MHRITRGVSFALTALLVGLAVGGPIAPPAAAHGYGSTGLCRFVATQAGTYGWTEALLRRIAVTPPRLYAKRSGGQKVGWRFTVERSRNRSVTPWRVTYRSPIQKANATRNRAANFNVMRVGVNVPTNVEDQNHVWYRVKVKMFWYRPNGTVASSESYVLTGYLMYVDGDPEGALDEYCPGLARQFFDGP